MAGRGSAVSDISPGELEGRLLAHAAMGQRDAQAALVAICIGKASIPEAERLALAEPFARLAASHGRYDDALILAGLLVNRAASLDDEERAANLRDEVTGIFDAVAEDCPADELAYLTQALIEAADAGDEHSAFWLNRLIDRLPPKVATDLNAFLNAETATQAS